VTEWAAVKSHLEIAQEATLRPVDEVAQAAGLLPDEVEPYGRYRGKVALEVLDRLRIAPTAN
jgi:formate--tetrahydrofolate ligase